MEYMNENNEVFRFDISDFTDKSFIEWDDGTTALNVFCLGQNIVADLFHDGCFDDEVVISEEQILSWIYERFDKIFDEVKKEVKYQLIFNPDINQGNVYVEDIIQ